MKIKIINPNTTQSMTDSVENLARRVARSDTQVWAVSPASGPDSIECYVDEHLAVPGVLKEVIRGDREEGADAFIIACFGDPGLQAAREVTSKPVLGICESAITAAKFIAPYFSIVSVLDRSRKVTEDVVANYGAEKFCRSIRSTGLSVLEFGRDPQRGLEALAHQGELAAVSYTHLPTAARTTARTAAFMPGASPPLVKTPIRFTLLSIIWLLLAEIIS